MSWVWSDELIGVCEEAGVSAPEMEELRRSEVAIAVPPGEDPLRWAAMRFGIDLAGTENQGGPDADGRVVDSSL